MVIVIFFVVHWYASLFFQSFFNHRYAAHQMFTMSKTWEKLFFIGSWLTNGSSYLSAYTYGVMHRMHHAYADTEQDPHSPKYSKSLFDMMLKTRDEYLSLSYQKKPVLEKFTKNVPRWDAFDKIGENIWVRIAWGLIYVAIWTFFATAWWQWIFLPMTLVIGPLHGAIINWFAHKYGYTNFEMKDTSKNFLPFDFLMWGESYHNNHHKRGSNPNFGYHWWELDPMYPIILLLDKTGVIKLKRRKASDLTQIQFSRNESRKIQAVLSSLPHLSEMPKIMPETKFSELVEAWNGFVKTDWKGNATEYLKNLHVRQELQVFLENVNGNLRKKLNGVLEPIDRHFKEKMKPIDSQSLRESMKGLGGQYFWQTHTILA